MKVMSRLLFVFGMFALGVALVCTNSASTTDASRFWINKTEQSGPLN